MTSYALVPSGGSYLRINDMQIHRCLSDSLCFLAVSFTVGGSIYLGTLWTEVVDASLRNADFIFAGPGLMGILFGVAVASYLMKSRLAFLLGAFGVFSGPILGKVRCTGGYLSEANANATQWAFTGIVGASFMLLFAYALPKWNLRKQFSITFLVVLIFLASVAMAIWRNIVS